MRTFWQYIGISAACLTMFSFIPQILKVLKTKSEKDLSLIMLFQLSLGVLLWIFYGIYLKDWIIITANSITLMSLAVLISLYYFFGRRNR